MSDMELDPGLLQDFITEATELLEDYTSSLTAFEEDPNNLETINPVFRAAHTLKGSSAFFGLTHIKGFAHKLENLLDDIRNKKKIADRQAIEYLFLGGNHLKAMFGRLAAGDVRPELTDEEAAFQEELVNWLGGGGGLLAESDTGGAEYEQACRRIKSILVKAFDTPRDPSEIIEDIVEILNPLPLDISAAVAEEDRIELPDPIAASYRGVDLSEPALRALGNIKSDEFDPKAYGLDLEQLSEMVGGNDWTEIKPLLDTAKGDFQAVFESGLDFDKTLTGLILSKYEDFLGALDLVYPKIESAGPSASAGAGFSTPSSVGYKGVDFSGPALRALDNLNSASFNPEAFEADLKTMAALVGENAWSEVAPLLEAVTGDFTAVHESPLDFDEMLVDLLKGKYIDFLKALDLGRREEIFGEKAAPGAEAGEKPAADSAASPAKAESKSMRISEEKVDGFMSYVGELIVTAETFNYLQKMIEKDKVNPNTVRAFKNANQAFRELSDELQESLMEIRRVPIKGILQKVNMMARELSHQLGKRVKVQLEGQEVQLDKSIAESLEGPLVHVVRNSLDHGLEPTEERERLGKNAEGLLRVSASADKEYFYMVVADDGKGIDPGIMRAAAVDKGLMSEIQASALTDKEAVSLIFGAGFSTAKTITDVSGRGVGMDVVRTNINALNGAINVDSVVGQGTAITMKIPLSVTLQVIKALHVRVGEANFIISLDDILESLRPMPEELSTIEGRGLVLNRRGQITPLIKLYEVFNLEPMHHRPEDGLVVMVETPAGRYAFLVDEVMGQQQVVVKELGAQFKRLSFLSGSALLGDGGLGLVLDTGGVVILAFGSGGVRYQR